MTVTVFTITLLSYSQSNLTNPAIKTKLYQLNIFKASEENNLKPQLVSIA